MFTAKNYIQVACGTATQQNLKNPDPLHRIAGSGSNLWGFKNTSFASSTCAEYIPRVCQPSRAGTESRGPSKMLVWLHGPGSTRPHLSPLPPGPRWSRPRGGLWRTSGRRWRRRSRLTTRPGPPWAGYSTWGRGWAGTARSRSCRHTGTRWLLSWSHKRAVRKRVFLIYLIYAKNTF